MKVFIEIFRMGLKSSFEYRGSFIISLVFDPLTLMLLISLLQVIYGNSQGDIILGYTLSQMIWYFVATRFFYYLIWNGTDKEISNAVLNGEMALRLIRPLSLLKWEFAKALSSKIFSFIFEFVPMLCICALLVYPDFFTWIALLKYLFICSLSFILFFLVSFIIGTVSFLWQSNQALVNIKTAIVSLMGGVAIPLEFYPEVLKNAMTYLPFQYLCYVPAQFLLNKSFTHNWNYFFEVVGIISIWIVIFYMVSVGFWNIGVKKYISAGG